MENKRYCSECQTKQKNELFEENLKTCKRCRAKKREQRLNNPEKHRESNQRYRDKIKDEIIKCSICNYEIKKYKQKQHEQSMTHQWYLKKLEDPDFEKDVPKPDEIKTIDDKEMYFCNICRSYCLPCLWKDHFNKSFHKWKVEKK